MIKVIPAEKIGIRFAPFAGIEGSYLVDPLSVYVSFVEEIKQHFPTLAFVHFVGDTRLDDFEYAPKQSLDVFRAALAFPYGMHEDVVGPHFVSSGAYSSEQAHAVAAKTTDLVCI